MKLLVAQLFSFATIVSLASCACGEVIQLEPSQGILIPAPIAHTLRIARAASGYNSVPSYGSVSSYSAPAKYSSPSAAPAYQTASIPAPPCPKNYLFSCQPSLKPIACSSPKSSYGTSIQGAYSQIVPQHVAPVVKELY